MKQQDTQDQTNPKHSDSASDSDSDSTYVDGMHVYAEPERPAAPPKQMANPRRET